MIRVARYFILPVVLLASTPQAVGATPVVLKAHISLPTTNQPDSLWAASDTQLVYQQDDPLNHPPVCESCGDPPFTDFQVHFYVADLRLSGTHLAVSPPRPLFTLPKGMHAALFSVVRGWVIYEPYSAAQRPENGGPWTLIARNIATGREVVFDSSALEGLPSPFGGALSDDTTVIWSTWTRGPNGGTSIIRTHNLLSGKRQVVAQGGSSNTWYYTWASISGNRVVYEKVTPRHHFQIMLKDLGTGRVQALTPASGDYSEPTISGNIVAWDDGAQFSQGKGIIVRNLKTGKQVKLPAFDAQIPRALAGRYVVWVHGKRTSEASYYIRLYDAATGSDRSLFQPNHGWGTGNSMRASQHTVIYDNGKPTGHPGSFLRRLTVARLR